MRMFLFISFDRCVLLLSFFFGDHRESSLGTYGAGRGGAGLLKKHVIKLRFKAVLNILPLHYTT